MSDIQEKIEAVREQAREACSDTNGDSGACAVLHEELEELRAEAAHQRAKAETTHKTSLQQYCDDNPDAAECRLYED